MDNDTQPLVFGPLGRRITHLVASPDGRTFALKHIPQNYSTDDYHEVVYRQEDGAYIEVGELPAPPAQGREYPRTMQRADFAPLDDGQCLSLETGPHEIALARYAAAGPGLVETARWDLGGTQSLCRAALRVLPSGRQAMVHIADRDDKYADWGGGPPPDYPQTYLLIDVISGEKLETFSITFSDSGGAIPGLFDAGGVSQSESLGWPSWMGPHRLLEAETMGHIAASLSAVPFDHVIHVGRRHLLTITQVINVATGKPLLQLADDQPQLSRMRAYPCFHGVSPDENYALSTVTGGEFGLWNLSTRTSWRPELPAHGGVHTAIFLPQGRAALGTAEGGVIVVDCSPSLAPGDHPW